MWAQGGARQSEADAVECRSVVSYSTAVFIQSKRLLFSMKVIVIYNVSHCLNCSMYIY